MKNQFYRTCLVTRGEYEIDAIFHRFERVSEMCIRKDESGIEHAAIVPKLVGVVERADGQIILVDPEQIRFADGFSARIIRNHYERMSENEEKDA